MSQTSLKKRKGGTLYVLARFRRFSAKKLWISIRQMGCPKCFKDSLASSYGHVLWLSRKSGRRFLLAKGMEKYIMIVDTYGDLLCFYKWHLRFHANYSFKKLDFVNAKSTIVSWLCPKILWLSHRTDTNVFKICKNHFFFGF